MPPINTIMVDSVLLPPDRRDPEVLAQAQRLLARAVAPVDAALEGRKYLIGDFSAADVMLGHAIFMANRLGQVSDEMKNLKTYVKRIESGPAFHQLRRPCALRCAIWTGAPAIRPTWSASSMAASNSSSSFRMWLE